LGAPLPENTLCRSSERYCDAPEYCDGTSRYCPYDAQLSYNWIASCGNGYDYCGPYDVTDPSFLSTQGIAIDGGNYRVMCGSGADLFIGSASSPIHQLPYPSCLSDCVPSRCRVNNEPMQNHYELHCNANNAIVWYIMNLRYDFTTTPWRKIEGDCQTTTQIYSPDSVPFLCHEK
jgi:hypothetical protein